MSVVQDRVQEIPAVNRIPSYFLDSGVFPFFENHPVKELITFLHPNILFHKIVNIVIGVQNFYLHMKQSGLAFDPHKVAGLFIKQLAININLHV